MEYKQVSVFYAKTLGILQLVYLGQTQARSSQKKTSISIYENVPDTVTDGSVGSTPKKRLVVE